MNGARIFAIAAITKIMASTFTSAKKEEVRVKPQEKPKEKPASAILTEKKGEPVVEKKVECRPIDLYPEELMRHSLSFGEAIAVIAFGLEKELEAQDKRILRELGTMEQLDAAAAELMNVIYTDYAKVLTDVLKFPCSEVWYEKEKLVNCFNAAINELRQGILFRYDYNCRMYLAKTLHPQLWHHEMVEEANNDSNMADWRSQLAQLLAEIRECDKRRDALLTRLESLLNTIEDCDVTTTKTTEIGVTHETNIAMLATTEPEKPFDSKEQIDVDGTIMQIRWSYRSRQVLNELGLGTVAETVAFFGDFHNFLDATDCITLMDWWIIQQVLRNYGLLTTDGHYTVEIFTECDTLELDIRLYNCLRRGGIDDLDDLAIRFANGAKDGWNNIQKIRHLGRKTLESLIQEMADWQVELTDDVCFPTPKSPIYALNFDREQRYTLQHYDIETVGTLLEACRDTNRFTGLRFINEELYKTAVDRLQLAGFEL